MLAETALAEESIQRIKRVFDQYSRFVCLEDDLFVITDSPNNQQGTFLGRFHENRLIRNCKTSLWFKSFLNFEFLLNASFICDSLMISPVALNKTSCTKSDIDAVISLVVDSLFSVFATLGTVPIVRCSRQNAAEEIAKGLDARFRDTLRDSRNTLFSGMEHRNFGENAPLSFHRPVLIILDRGLDMATPLHHAWTYQSLVHDIVVG